MGRASFDEVADVSTKVTLRQSGGSFEASLPLELLHLAPALNKKVLGDIGVLRGAGQTVRRSYWNNRNTAIVSDVPSEARLQPANWGLLVFNKKQ